MLVSYIFYPRYIRGSVTCLDALLFQTVVPRQKKFRNTQIIMLRSYIKDTANFLDKLKDLGEDVEVLPKQYDKFLQKKVPTEDIIKMADFVLKNNIFEFK